jgi:hypothetical protein
MWSRTAGDQVFFADFFALNLRPVFFALILRAVVRFVTRVAADFSPPSEDVPGAWGLTSFSAISFTSSPDRSRCYPDAHARREAPWCRTSPVPG